MPHEADDVLVERRDERRLADLLQRREVLADALSRRSRGRARGSVRRGAARRPAWPRGSWAWASASAWLADGGCVGFGRGLGVVGGSRAAFRLASCAAARRRRAMRPSPSRRDCADNPRPPRASPSGPSRPSRTPACPTRRSGRPCRSGACRACGRASGPASGRGCGRSRRARRARVAHSVSTTWRTRPTRPPTSVPLMRIYWRSRPTAASSRSVTVRASQPRIVSETSLTIEPP